MVNNMMRTHHGVGGGRLILILGTFLLLVTQDVHGAREYYGKLIGQLTTYAHKVSGKVYAVDEDTLFIKDFTYDGLGPDAYFWIGTGKNGDPSPSGVLVPYPDDYSDREPPVLRDFDHEDVILHLPPGYKVKEIAWLSVWCRRFTVNFGDVKIPKNLKVPQRKVLPEFKRLAHGVRSGNITILDSRTFYIPNLYYDGAGPDAFFWVGTGTEPHTGGRKIPNEKGSLDVLSGYEGEDIEITLPEELTVYDIDWLSMWCISYKHNFGHVLIPKQGLDVPPSLDKFKRAVKSSSRSTPYPIPYHIYTNTRNNHHHHHHNNNNFNKKSSSTVATPKAQRPKDSYSNCRDLLNKDVQLQWEVDGEYVKFKLSGRISEKQWVALGFSPMKGRTQMVGADAVVVYHTPNQREKFHADDYYMSAKSQCDGKDGVCPDKRIGGKNDVQVLGGARRNGVTTVQFRKPMKPMDKNWDMALDGEEINIFVAIGNLNGRNEANYHFGQRTGSEEDIRIAPKGTNDHSCIKLIDESPAENGPSLRPWPSNIIEGVTNFTARIGPTGGKRGYTVITEGIIDGEWDLLPGTGNPSWGIAWFINDQLIPEIYVERGQTYHFWVEGGDDSGNPAKYHPFYITNSSEGGYGQKSEYEQSQQKVYAGVDYDIAGYPFPTAAGRYCEWEHKTVDKSATSETFQDFMKTLNLVCEDGRPSQLSWTVSMDAPDLLYYQCYTHNNLGWKIHVVNSGERVTRDTLNSSSPSGGATLSVLSLAISSFLVITAAI
ncbi:protein Skeletor, isoforms B/C isoform X3 [Folsomia candida]|uniref:protein Skeletor, isoforms B/C isoform X3 n=1 Tax=Folsomia candida TaxID=158441 RepID=UPI000B8FCAE4|nr:protein Skeletor, isoforms B/C isoform X3 [Folsomia candida]